MRDSKGVEGTPAASDAGAGTRALRYQDHYAWYLLAASLDVMVTTAIIEHFDGWEANKIAAYLIERFGLWGLVGLKYSTVIFVILMCEYIGRRNAAKGRRLATLAILVSALPVGLGLIQVYLATRGRW